MSNEPRYPDLEEKELPEQVSELKDYIVNLHRYIRYANNHIDKSNLTRRLADEINTFVDDDGVIHILDEIDFNERVDFTNYVTFTNLSDPDDETVIDAGHIKTGIIDASVLNLSSYAKFSDLADENNYTIIHGGNILTGTIDADQLSANAVIIGGVNLLANSKKDAGQSHSTYNVCDFDFTEQLKEGQKYTLTAKVNVSADKKAVRFCHSGGSTAFSPAWLPVSEDGTYTVTFTATAAMAEKTGGAYGFGFCRCYASNNTSGGQTPLTGTANVEWIQIERGNRASDWSSSAKDIGIAGTTIISGGNITTGTIDASVVTVTNINASEINSGTIDAARLNLTNYATFTDVSDAIDDIEIGGRNLLRGSNEFTYAYDLKWENAHWYILSGGNGVAQINTINDAPLPTITKSISVLNNTTGNRDIGQRFIPTEIGETYTISGYVRIPSNSSYNSVTMLVRLYGSNTDISLNKAITNTEWKYFFVTGQAKTGTNRTCQFGLSGAGDIEYCGVKMEKGNKATDWTPAPEDVDDAIGAKKSTHTLMSSSTLGATYSAILSWIEEGRSGTWNVTSTSGVKVGDTVRIGYYVSNMDMAVVYCVGTVTAINSATNLTMISHGLATTVIDGGNILANTVGANQLKVNEINASKSLAIGAFTDATQSEVKNSEIEVGGTNLIQNSQYMTYWSAGTNGVLVDESAAEGFNSWKLTGTTSNWSAKLETRPNLDPIYLTRGSDFNLSFEYKCSEDVQLTSLNISGTAAAIGSTTGSRTKYRSIWGTIDLPSTNGVWKKFNVGSKYVSLEKLTYGSGDVNSWFFEVYCRDNGKVVWLRKLKIELGNKATDWTPAPEDVDDAIDVASQTATKYITYVDSTNGIRVHNAADTTDYVQVNSSAIGMYRNNTEKMRITDSLLRLGEASKTRTEISSSGVTLYDDSNDSIASFGSTARIGKTSSSRFLVNSDSLEAYNSSNEKYFGIEENEISIYNGGTKVTGIDYDPYLDIVQFGIYQHSMSIVGSTVSLAGVDAFPNVYIDGDPIHDFVIMKNTGTENNTWYYRKWRSGKQECWGRFTLTGVAFGTASGALYTQASALSVANYPSNFKSIPSVHIMCDGTTGAWATTVSAGTQAAPPTFKLMRTVQNTSSQTVYVDIYAIG